MQRWGIRKLTRGTCSLVSSYRHALSALTPKCSQGQDREALLGACSADGPQLPVKPGEYGKGLDLLGAMRPACRSAPPWEFPTGTHTLLVCDVAVGIPWRVPDKTHVYGEWDDEASGVTAIRMADWAISQTGCELLSPLGWMRVATGGRAEAQDKVHSDQVLCFSLRVCSTYAPLPEVREERKAMGGLQALCVLERGEFGADSLARFGLALVQTTSATAPRPQQLGTCALMLVREGKSIQQPQPGAPKLADARGAACDDGESSWEPVELGQLEEGLWYAVEIRVSPYGEKEREFECMRVDVFAGRGGGGVVGRQDSSRLCICSHQSMVCPQADQARGNFAAWTASVQVSR